MYTTKIHEGTIRILAMTALITRLVTEPLHHSGVPILLKQWLIPKTAPIQAKRVAVCRKLNQGPTTSSYR